MAYDAFSLRDVQQKFDIKFKATFAPITTTIQPKQPSEILQATLAEQVPLALAIHTEKARSELIITPILVELRRVLQQKISLFSGIDFTMDTTKGLNGRCDFIVSKNPNQWVLTAPVITLVEAKNDNINSGLGQCIAEMIAAQLFNRKHKQAIPTIYGVVTTGSLWRFLKLEDKLVTLDAKEYYLENIDKILGILIAMLNIKT